MSRTSGASSPAFALTVAPSHREIQRNSQVALHVNGKLGLIHVILTKKVCLAPDCLPAVSRALFELSLLENKPSGEEERSGRIKCLPMQL